MATYDANIVRACAIELKEKVFDLYLELLPMVTTLNSWTLNGLDPALPGPFAVKVQLDTYKALTLDRLKLEPWVSDLQKALVDDTLTYPSPPIVGGLLAFDEISFEHINF
jgi:hypothetical protein